MQDEYIEQPEQKLYCIFTSIPDGIILPLGHKFGKPNSKGEYMVRNCYESQYPDHCRDITRAEMMDWKAKYEPLNSDSAI